MAKPLINPFSLLAEDTVVKLWCYDENPLWTYPQNQGCKMISIKTGESVAIPSFSCALEATYLGKPSPEDEACRGQQERNIAKVMWHRPGDVSPSGWLVPVGYVKLFNHSPEPLLVKSR